uniref:TolC family protein n=1 Tax=Acidobacterium capsulatum TaxID=33075 RepID=A0A7V4XU56_9BACT
MSKHAWIVTATLLATSLSAVAQSGNASALPAAPAMHLTLQMNNAAGVSSGQNPPLTRQQAEQMALRNNPRISASKLLAMAQQQGVREARAAYLPDLTGAVTAVKADTGSRVSASSLTASRLITHAGAGGELSQLITDFGHTRNLILTQKLEAQAANANALATKEEIVLYTDQAFYNALTAQAILRVAQQTVKTRQITETQVNQLTAHKLRSTLDLSFAQVNLSEAKLMELDAENNAAASMAQLDAILGLDHSVEYQLVEDHATAPAPPVDLDSLVQQAIQQRPDLMAMNYGTRSEQKYAHAERDQLLPTISAMGTVGATPVRVDRYYTSNWWGAVGVNMNVPIFNGFLYNAQAKAARERAEADAENARDLKDQIVRDVHTSWLRVNTAYQRLTVTTQLVQEADMGLKLAQTRYNLGLSSIVELSQAQLQQTRAQIEATNARYEYRLALATLRYQTGQLP